MSKMATATPSKPIKPKVKRTDEQQKIFDNDKKVREYVICQIRNQSEVEDNDIELLRWGRIALDQTETKDWTIGTLGLEGKNDLKNSVKALYNFQEVLNRIQTYEDTFKTISIIESENIHEFTTRFNAWNTKPRKCELSPKTKKREEAIKEAATTKAAKTKEAEKKRKNDQKKKAEAEKTADSNAKKDEKQYPLPPPSHIRPSSPRSPASPLKQDQKEKDAKEKKAEQEAQIKAAEKAEKAAENIRKRMKQREAEAESQAEAEAEAEDQKDKIELKPVENPKPLPEKKQPSEIQNKIDLIEEMEQKKEPQVLDLSRSFDLQNSGVNPDKESVITLSSLLKKIDDTKNDFLEKIVVNLKKLMDWKIKRYDLLLAKLFGKKEELEEFISQQKKKAKAEKDEKFKLNTKEFIGKAYLTAQEQCRKKLKEIKKESVKNNLVDAITNPQNGIISLQGKSRENIRNQLLKTILSLSRNITRFQEGNNIILMGGSGSGKTKTASVIGYVYSKIGILANDTFRDVQPSSMMSSLVNGTTILTARKILENLEGSMLIDEAYSFLPRCTNVALKVNQEMKEKKKGGSDEDNGSEALNQIVYQIDELKGLIVVIMAGYEGSMRCLMESNEGIDRRFSTQTTLMDYENWDLTQMLMKKINNSIETDSDDKVKKQKLKDEEIQFLFNAISYLSREQKTVFAKQAGAIDLLSRQFAMLLSEFDDDTDLRWTKEQDHVPILTKMFNNFLLSLRIPWKLSYNPPQQMAPNPSYSQKPVAVAANPFVVAVPAKAGYQNQTTWARFPKIRF